MLELQYNTCYANTPVLNFSLLSKHLHSCGLVLPPADVDFSCRRPLATVKSGSNMSGVNRRAVLPLNVTHTLF